MTPPQPDPRSCGAACLVAARMLVEPGYAARVQAPEGWRDEVLAVHRSVTGPLDARGAIQLPWPRALGTPPWAFARQLQATLEDAGHPVRYRTRLVLDRAAAFDRLRNATGPAPSGLYIGSRLLPRHIVLVVSARNDAITCYDPARGGLVDVSRQRFVAGPLDLSGWSRPWFEITPRGR